MTDFHTERESVYKLTEDECWAFLGEREFGRLAFHLVGEVHITPINYCANDHTIFFRTSEGSKLLGITMNDDVAFETDEFTDMTATSVVARGRATQLDGPEKDTAAQLPLRPWVPAAKQCIVRIDIDEISGRRFDLSKPWEHMRL